jgi:hypothetical protein
MGTLRKIIRKIPQIFYGQPAVLGGHVHQKSKPKGMADIFTDIYRNNSFGGKDSVSGPGSDVQQTRVIASELPNLLRALNAASMLDLPCGDFHWMKGVDLRNTDYTGADIVTELITINNKKYARAGARFQRLNLIKDKLPKVDLILCRDCLVHFSFADICFALNNVCNSQSEYLLTTTFTDRKENRDIATGEWRALNLELAPFGLPKPLKTINEGCTEDDGVNGDKSLGLWRIEDIRQNLHGSAPDRYSTAQRNGR